MAFAQCVPDEVSQQLCIVAVALPPKAEDCSTGFAGALGELL